MHVDPELLSLIALGEEAGTPDDQAHAQSCLTCAEEIADLQRLVTLGRTFGATDELVTPSPAVWARIQDELELSGGQDSAAGITDVDHLTSEPAARPPRPSLMAAVAAALGDPAHSSAALVAQGRLSSPGADAGLSGEAVIATDELGRRILQVALDADRPASGLRRAWLVHRDDPDRRQSLGILDGAYGVWTIDRSIDLAQFAIVDISLQEPSQDEQPGRSIVRGELALAV